MLRCRSFCCPLAIVSMLAMGGCGGLLESERPAIQTWWLEPVDIVAVAQGPAYDALRLDFAVAPGLGSNRIMSLDPQARFSPYAGSVWVEDLPELLEFLMIAALADSGMYGEVSERIPVTGSNHCRLYLQTTAFHSRLDGNGVTASVEVAFEGRYRCGEVKRAVRARSEIPVRGNRMEEIVAVFQRALDKATLELLGQLES